MSLAIIRVEERFTTSTKQTVNKLAQFGEKYEALKQKILEIANRSFDLDPMVSASKLTEKRFVREQDSQRFSDFVASIDNYVRQQITPSLNGQEIPEESFCIPRDSYETLRGEFISLQKEMEGIRYIHNCEDKILGAFDEIIEAFKSKPYNVSNNRTLATLKLKEFEVLVWVPVEKQENPIQSQFNKHLPNYQLIRVAREQLFRLYQECEDVEVQHLALNSLIQIVNADPLKMETAAGLLTMQQKLLEGLRASKFQFLTLIIQRDLAQLYASILQSILLHVGSDHINALTAAIKEEIWSSAEESQSINEHGIQDPVMDFYSRYAIEAIKEINVNVGQTEIWLKRCIGIVKEGIGISKIVASCVVNPPSLIDVGEQVGSVVTHISGIKDHLTHMGIFKEKWFRRLFIEQQLFRHAICDETSFQQVKYRLQDLKLIEEKGQEDLYYGLVRLFESIATRADSLMISTEAIKFIIKMLLTENPRISKATIYSLREIMVEGKPLLSNTAQLILVLLQKANLPCFNHIEEDLAKVVSEKHKLFYRVTDNGTEKKRVASQITIKDIDPNTLRYFISEVARVPLSLDEFAKSTSSFLLMALASPIEQLTQPWSDTLKSVFSDDTHRLDSQSRTPYHIAAKLGNAQLFDNIKKYLPNYDINAYDSEGKTALYVALTYNNIMDSVTQLLELDANPDQPNLDGSFALHYCYQSIAEITAKKAKGLSLTNQQRLYSLYSASKKLLEHKASIDIEDKDKKLPFDYIMDKDNVELFDQLFPSLCQIRQEIYPVSSDEEKETCIESGEEKVIEESKEGGYIISSERLLEQSPLLYASRYYKWQPSIKIATRVVLDKIKNDQYISPEEALSFRLLFNIDIPNPSFPTWESFLEHTQSQVEKTHDYNSVFSQFTDVTWSYFRSPLETGSYQILDFDEDRPILKDSEEIEVREFTEINQIIQNKLNVHYQEACEKGLDTHKDIFGNTAAHLAAMLFHDSAILKELITKKASFDQFNITGLTPVMIAVLLNNITALEIMCEEESGKFNANISLNKKTPEGFTALHLAVYLGFTKAIELLSKRSCSVCIGVDVQDRSLYGETPLMTCCSDITSRKPFLHIPITATVCAPLPKRRMSAAALRQLINSDQYAHSIREGEEGAFKELTDQWGNTCLHLLVQIKENETCSISEIIKTLLEMAPLLFNETNAIWQFPIHLLDESSQYLDIFKTWLEKQDLLALEKTFHEKNEKYEYKSKELADLLIEFNFLDMFNTLLSQKRCIGERTNETNALHVAAKYDRCSVVESYHSNGLPLDIKNALGESAAHIAAEHDQVDFLKALIAKDPSTFSKDNEHNNILHFAAKGGALRVIKSLKAKQRWLRLKHMYIDKKKDTTLTHLKAKHSTNIAVHLALEENNQGDNSLEMACRYDKVEALKELYQWVNSGLNHPNFQGRVALHIAALVGSIDCVTYLVEECSVDTDVKDTFKNTPLILAAGEGNLDVLQILIENGADQYASNDAQQNAMHAAIAGEHISCVECLLKVSPKLMQEEDSTGQTPLLILAKSCKQDGRANKILNLLIQKEIDLEKKNSRGCSFIHEVCRQGRDDLLKDILENCRTPETGMYSSRLKVKLNKQEDETKNSCLHIACQEGKRDIFDLLMEESVPLRPMNTLNRPPLHEAILNKHFSLAEELLLKHKVGVSKLDINDQSVIHHLLVTGVFTQKTQELFIQLANRNSSLLNKKDKDGNTLLITLAQSFEYTSDNFINMKPMFDELMNLLKETLHLSQTKLLEFIKAKNKEGRDVFSYAHHTLRREIVLKRTQIE